MNWRTSCWKAKSSGLNSMSITKLPLGTDALIMGAHLYVNGKLLLATFPDRMIAPNAPACPAGRSHGRGPPLEARDEHDGAFAGVRTADFGDGQLDEIGRASWRERVCQHV